jgi:predicted nucleic acid-binding protein
VSGFLLDTNVVSMLSPLRAEASDYFVGWLEGLVANYDDNIIPVDTVAATLASRLEAKAISARHNCGMADATIAGIAKAHAVVIVTRNTKHFQVFGIDVLSPEEATQSALLQAPNRASPRGIVLQCPDLQVAL